jgi:hypothetical protein
MRSSLRVGHFNPSEREWVAEPTDGTAAHLRHELTRFAHPGLAQIPRYRAGQGHRLRRAGHRSLPGCHRRDQRDRRARREVGSATDEVVVTAAGSCQSCSIGSPVDRKGELRVGARGAAQAYECTEGAALQPLPLGYHRRQPEKGILHEVVRENLESFLAELREEGRDLPRFVEQELRRSASPIAARWRVCSRRGLRGRLRQARAADARGPRARAQPDRGQDARDGAAPRAARRGASRCAGECAGRGAPDGAAAGRPSSRRNLRDHGRQTELTTSARDWRAPLPQPPPVGGGAA